MNLSCAEEVQHYVRTGRHEEDFYLAWPGEVFFARAAEAKAALRRGLVDEVLKLTPHATMLADLAEMDVAASRSSSIVFSVKHKVHSLDERSDQNHHGPDHMEAGALSQTLKLNDLE